MAKTKAVVWRLQMKRRGKWEDIPGGYTEQEAIIKKGKLMVLLGPDARVRMLPSNQSPLRVSRYVRGTK